MGAFPLGKNTSKSGNSTSPPKPCPPARLRFFRCFGWISLSPQLGVFHVPPSADSRPRQWPLSADNGQREECRRRAGLEQGQSALRSRGPSGCCREGPAGSLLKGPHYGTRSLWKMDALGSGGVRAARWPWLQARARYLLYQPPGPPAAAAPASRLGLMKKQTVTPKAHQGLLFPTLPLPQCPAWASTAGSPAKKGLIHPLRWKLAFSRADCVTVLWWNRLQSSRSFGKRKTDKGPRLEPGRPSARHVCSL